VGGFLLIRSKLFILVLVGFLLFSFVSGRVAHASLSDGLVLWLPMDEGSGVIAYDASGHANHGTVIANWTTGYNEGGLSFNGTTDYVDCGTSSSLKPTSAITLSAWVKSLSSDYQAIVGLDAFHKFFSLYNLYQIDGWWHTALLEEEFTFNLPSNYNDGNYHHVILTYSSIDGYLRLYWDGQLVSGSKYYGGNIVITNDYPITIGAREGGASLFYYGNIDDVRVYNRVLSETEITQLYTLYDAAEALPTLNVQWMWIYLFEGDFIGFFDTVLTSTFNNYSLAVAIIVLIFMAALYIRTSSFPLVCIAWLLIGGFLIVAMPIVSGLALIFCALGIGGGIVYRLFRPPS